MTIIAFWPHALMLMTGWFMTVSPGTLFFHRLRSFEVFTSNFHINGDVSITPSEVMTVPYVRNFLYTLSVIVFAICWYFFNYIRANRNPDLSLFVISLAPTVIAGLRILVTKRGLFLMTAVINSLVSFAVTKLGLMMFRVDPLVAHCLVLIQYVSLAPSVATNALCYYRYTHPRAALLNCESCYETLRKIYSTKTNVFVVIWHHWDFVVVFGCLLCWKYAVERTMSLLLCLGAISSFLFSVPTTACLLQMQMIDLLLPAIDKEVDDIKTLIKPIGRIAFGLLSHKATQVMFVNGWIFCNTFHSDKSETYSQDLLLLVFTGEILSTFSRIMSAILRIRKP